MPFSTGSGVLSTDIFTRDICFFVDRRWPLKIELGSSLDHQLGMGSVAALVTDEGEELWIEVEGRGVTGWRAKVVGGNGADKFFSRFVPEYGEWLVLRDKSMTATGAPVM